VHQLWRTVSRHWLHIFRQFLQILKAQCIKNDNAQDFCNFNKLYFLPLNGIIMTKISNSAKTSHIWHHCAPLDELNTNPFTKTVLPMNEVTPRYFCIMTSLLHCASAHRSNDVIIQKALWGPIRYGAPKRPTKNKHFREAFRLQLAAKFISKWQFKVILSLQITVSVRWLPVNRFWEFKCRENGAR
jgi:hypothetical protein